MFNIKIHNNNIKKLIRNMLCLSGIYALLYTSWTYFEIKELGVAIPTMTDTVVCWILGALIFNIIRER